MASAGKTLYDREGQFWYGERIPPVINPAAGIGRIVLDALVRSPNKVIQINADTGRLTTCAEMRLRIVRVALNLRRLGFKRGEYVSLACANGEHVVPVLIGCWVLGLVVNPLATVFGLQDYVHMMKQTQSRLVFCDQTNRAVVEQAVRDAITAKDVRLIVMDIEGPGSVDELLKPIDGEDTFRAEYLGDATKLVAMVLCSSGTTGPPKGVWLSHAHYIDDMFFSAEISDRPIFNFSAHFWATGNYTVLTSLIYSRPRVITSSSFNPELLLNLIEKYRIETLCTPPSYVAALLAHPRLPLTDLSSVRYWHLGGAKYPDELVLQMQPHIPNANMRSIYGSSEMGFISNAAVPVSVPSCAGSLATNLECRLVDEAGEVVGPGEQGEVLVRHRHMFLGYLNNPEATKNALTDDGFFRTGDIGYMQADGNLFLVDRIKDIIKYNGYQISPSDLEGIIQKIDGVKQACVIGIPSEDGASDLPTAVVERMPGATIWQEDIVRIVDGQVADFKRLRGGVHFVDSFPMTASGKVLRRAVRSLMLEGSS